MKKKFLLYAFLFSLANISFFNWRCTNSEIKESQSKLNSSPYLNHGDSARFVGMNTCKTCHENIYNTFIETGMGRSFDAASKLKSAALFGKQITVYDKFSNFHYYPFFKGDTMKILEFRLKGKDTVYQRLETVSYIIGSGQHTNSHMMMQHGFVTQMPLTFYTQKQQWDLPPGFEDGHNTRFNRKIGLECMSCHNSFPEFEIGSENKYTSLPNGIGCERCHGPGSIHVSQKSKGQLIDTAKYIDYSIVNPGKIDPNLQFDICQRCHLQGNAVLKNGHSFYDFKPGQKLSDFMTVFLPKYKNAEDEFIMASHADRLKQSKCFIESKKNKSAQVLRPYKNTMTCVTCHNPHQSVKFQKDEFFNQKCKNCHDTNKELLCTEEKQKLVKANSNCVSCHMPRSGSIDIPHVTVHDHYIRKPITKNNALAQQAKVFLGLHAINENKPDANTMALAYINQFEKFEKKSIYLDSAAKYVNILLKEPPMNHIHTIIHINFLKENYSEIIKIISSYDQDKLLKQVFVKKSFDNADAWICYRIGEAYQTKADYSNAKKFYEKAYHLAPYYPDFLNKYASTCLNLNEVVKAQQLFEKLVKDFPNYATGYSNLGYLFLIQENISAALFNFEKALQLDPDYELALLNKASILMYQHKSKEAKDLLKQILVLNPNQEKAKQALEQLK
jgi:tetratricopeptide (TPR) repeat protein